MAANSNIEWTQATARASRPESERRVALGEDSSRVERIRQTFAPSYCCCKIGRPERHCRAQFSRRRSLLQCDPTYRLGAGSRHSIRRSSLTEFHVPPQEPVQYRGREEARAAFALLDRRVRLQNGDARRHFGTCGIFRSGRSQPESTVDILSTISARAKDVVGDPAEWPLDLRVRQMPEVSHA